ncbi:hypothetical protein LCGC14_0323870 [marine sediment metagenome]|uniref:N-acetyltransferase domain-containing protein n=1 Tax=marine sediment metagenome TaxID=412755 RepID=A0A0F9W5R1_9ZZZZ|nr:GNAT family N-acetyltransferase [Halomonas sp.]HEB04762.1 GNAT family N-acetyltransferase [Halomonas sp.]
MLKTDVLKYEVICDRGVPELCRQLIWDVFFASKGRGIDLSTHFPWIDSPEGVFCISIKNPKPLFAEEVIATTIIKVDGNKENTRLGLVGLVCVAEKWRGNRLTTSLLNSATDLARLESLGALVLWTQKPAVYTRQGFVQISQEMYGEVKKNVNRVNKASYIKHTSKRWPNVSMQKKGRGLPAFASGGRIITSNSAEVIVLESPGGETVAEWHGSISDVVDLLENALSNQWMINVDKKDSIIDELKARNFEINLQLSSMQLVKKINNDDLIVMRKFNLLDRI